MSFDWGSAYRAPAPALPTMYDLLVMLGLDFADGRFPTPRTNGMHERTCFDGLPDPPMFGDDQFVEYDGRYRLHLRYANGGMRLSPRLFEEIGT